MATIVHFNITAKDPEKIRAFYTKLFNWEINRMPGPESYYMIGTTDLQGKKGLGGGIAKKEEEQATGIVNFIGVSSIEGLLNKVVSEGGRIVQSPQEVPGFGVLAICQDPEQNLFGVFEEIVPASTAKAQGSK